MLIRTFLRNRLGRILSLGVALQCSASLANADLELFVELLNFHHQHPELRPEAEKLAPVPHFEPADLRIVQRLSESVLESRFRSYNPDYRISRERLNTSQNRYQELKKRLEEIPITSPEYATIELSLKTIRSDIRQITYITYLQSIEANESLLNAIDTLDDDERVVSDPEAIPDMPGVYGGSAFARRRLEEIEKLNLTPVDPEFYQTQLGKKIESDLGGRADFWSYNYEEDQLFVKVGDELGRLIVLDQPGGLRFIRTQIGQDFSEIKGSDQEVDMFNARGRFLRGESSETTLFGEFPDSRPEFMDERPVHGRQSDHD